VKTLVTIAMETRSTIAAACLLLIAGCDGKGTDGPNGNNGDDSGTSAGVEQIWVNEVMAANSATLQDEVGKYPDWIELHNPNEVEVEVGGWWLTDDVTDPLKWQIPAGLTIPAEGFVVFFADSDTEEGDLHASFNLDADGGDDVGLFGPNELGNPLVDALEDMALAVPDVSLARIPDGGPTWEIEADPTPGASNG
jgi:hypothetical protein